MTNLTIPIFIKNMGHKIISYILNISEDEAKMVLESKYNLNRDETTILTEFIDICRRLRIQGIDQGDVDLSIYYNLPKFFIKGRHIFNIWNESMGGKQESIFDDDPILTIVNQITVQLYPLFLLKISGHTSNFIHMNSYVGSVIYSLPEYKELCNELLKDESISKVFHKVGKNEMDTYGSFRNSTGRGGGIQLASLPNMFIMNSFELMRMRDQLSLQDFAKAAKDTIDMIRRCANGETIDAPVFIGFNNISLNNHSEIETEWGTLRPYNEGITELVPNNTSTTTINGKQHKLGFVLESKSPYKVDFGENLTSNKWPKELDITREQHSNIKENICLCFALACERTPPVGLSFAWTMSFDPFSHGTSISWKSDLNSPVKSYILNDTDDNNLLKWCKIIKGVEDGKIRLAIRRILSAINERNNPIDGFVDTIIAWENLFSGRGELTFKISISIAKLLGTSEDEKRELQKFVVKHYDHRSRLVHGGNEVSYENAVEYRDKCLDVALRSLRKLYIDRVDLIDKKSSDRSTQLALL